MDAELYQKLASRTLIEAPGKQYSSEELTLVWNAIGLGGKTGDVLEHVKKGVFHEHGIDDERLRQELYVCFSQIVEFYRKNLKPSEAESFDTRYDPFELMLAWNAIGLGGEAGEAMRHIWSGIFQGKGVDTEKLEKELGDCLWYIAAICTKLQISMASVMEKNIAKLDKRYPTGWNPADSHHTTG